MRKTRVMIGIISFDGLATEATRDFLKAFYELGKKHSEKYEFLLEVMTKREQFRARNLLVDYALGADCDYMWQIDDDTVLKPDTFEVLMRGLEGDPLAGVIGAFYVQRGTPHHAVVMRGGRLENGAWFSEYIPRHEITGGVMEVLVTGGGCFLFRMEPFKEMMRPYFWSDGEVGTDVQICLKLQERGWKVLCDTGHEVGHVGSGEVWYPSTIPQDIVEFNRLKRDVSLDAQKFLGLEQIAVQDLAARAIYAGERHWKSKPRGTFEEVCDFYTNEFVEGASIARGVWYNLFGDVGMSGMIELNSMVSKGLFGREGDVLDYGCGIGLPTQIFARHGFSVHAMDLPSASFEFLKARSRGELASPGFDDVEFTEIKEPLPYLEEQAYDVVVVMDVIEHLTNPREVLVNLIKAIKPGGFLITNAHTCHFKGEEDGNPQHLNLLANEEILGIYQEMGMKQSEFPKVLKKEG